jgi:DNA-binding PucR family transcriptional regulator
LPHAPVLANSAHLLDLYWRLDRFEEATGRSLRETETLAEVWWALNRRRLG